MLEYSVLEIDWRPFCLCSISCWFRVHQSKCKYKGNVSETWNSAVQTDKARQEIAQWQDSDNQALWSYTRLRVVIHGIQNWLSLSKNHRVVWCGKIKIKDVQKSSIYFKMRRFFYLLDELDKIIHAWIRIHLRSSFSQTIRKCHYWHFRPYCMKTKKSSDKMLPRVGIEPRQPLILSPTLSFLHLFDMCCLGDL